MNPARRTKPAAGRLLPALTALLLSACGGQSERAPDAGPGPGNPGNPPLAACSDTATRAAPAGDAAAALPAGLSVERVFPTLAFVSPVAMVQAPGDRDHWYVVEQSGRIYRFDLTNRSPLPALDLSVSATEPAHRRVQAGGERGLLGLALHPDYPDDARAFVSYTTEFGSPGQTRSEIASLVVTDQGARFDPNSLRVLLSQAQPFSNHNGGQIAFGPDGYLYIGLGDGGSGNDPQGHGQNCETLLGSILRIDVADDGATTAYRVPPGNPFAAAGGGAAEIFAWGFRNPWRWSFDRATGRLWYGDVGQNRFEEVGIAACGGNHGWRLREGFEPLLDDSPAASCPAQTLLDPTAAYDHASGDCSVTGGYVYRGEAHPALQGIYLYADFCSGRIRGLPAATDDAGAAAVLVDTDLSIAAFAEANDGELYVLDRSGGGIYRIGLP